MPDIKLNCPHCQQSLEAPPDMAGEQIDCPACSQMLTVPQAEKRKVVVPKRPLTNRPLPHSESSRQQPGSKFHLAGLSTIAVLLLAFFLPFTSISCNNEKLLSLNGYGLLQESFAGGEDTAVAEFTSNSESVLTVVILVGVIVLAAAVAILSCTASAKRNRASVVWGCALAVVGLLLLLSLGYMYGVHSEGRLKAEQAKSLHDSDGWEDLGAAFAASMDIRISMDAGYYLSLVAFLAGILAFLLPYALHPPISAGDIAWASAAGGTACVSAVACIVACLVTLSHPAQYSSPKAMEEEFASNFESAAFPSEHSVSHQDNETPPGVQNARTGRQSSLSISRPKEYKATLPEKFLDFELGCSIDDATRTIESGVQRVSRAGENGNRTGQYTLMYSGNNSLADADNTMLMFWRGKLYMVIVVFSGDNDKCERLFQVLKHKVTEKYGKEKSIISVSDKAEWSLRGLTVVLEREIGIMDDGKVYLAGIHDWLSTEVEKYKLQSEADGLGEL